MRVLNRLACFLFVFALVEILAPHVSAQTSLRRLTTTGDVMEFVWSPKGDSLFVTRAGQIVSLSPTRQQITGQLYQIEIESAQSELLASNANAARPSPNGNEIAFTRPNANGSAQLIRLQLATKAERNVDAVTWGAIPQWNRAGNTLYYAQSGRLTQSAPNGRVNAFNGQNLPLNAQVSPLGDSAAYVDTRGLWVTQANGTTLLVQNANGTSVLSDVQWSNTGDELAYIVTHNGFDPEVWVADIAHGTIKKITQGQLVHLAGLAWSPDDTYVIFVQAQTGTMGETEIWRAIVGGSRSRMLRSDNASDELPQYSPDGSSIAFLRDGDVWVMNLNDRGLPQAQNLPRSPLNFKQETATPAQRTPPATIRVQHGAANSCRSAPIGQIDTLEFETYIKRVVPAEVYATWNDDALKTQAVAARTFAWFWILQHSANDFDVTDTTAYQYMCDTRYASTDNATDGTRGQYLNYQGNMVFAAYGAENGDPTLTNNFSNPYLIGVDDPVGFLQTRAGNGLGMSQWGAQRWASQYGWNYQQILLHYYSNVTMESPAGTMPDTTPPIGGIITPWSNWGITSNHVQLHVSASDDASGVASIDLNAQYFDGTTQHNTTIATLNGSARDFTWDVSALPNQTGITIIPVIHDNAHNSFTGSSITFDLDRQNPQGTLNAPASSPNQNVTLTLNASDSGGSGLQTMMFSNNWEWQGENQNVQAGSGDVVNDADALNERALRGLVGINSAGAWYGPYTNVLAGNQAYRAYFRLKTDHITTPNEIALLDVVSDGGATIRGLKSVHGTDFKAANQYQEFYVDFAGPTATDMEFRVAYHAVADLWLDRILVVRYPIAYGTSSQWTLSPGNGLKRVIAKFADGAGNVSTDAIASIYVGSPPTPAPKLTPREWLPLIEK